MLDGNGLIAGLVNKLSSIFVWLRLRLAVSAKLGLPTSRPAFCFLASLVLAGAKTKPNFFTSPKLQFCPVFSLILLRKTLYIKSNVPATSKL